MPDLTIHADPHHAREDLRMLRQAIRKGWITGERWPTDATIDDIVKVSRERKLTLKEQSALAVMKGLSSGEERIQQQAAKTAVAMESQNQADEIKLRKVKRAPNIIMQAGSQTVIVQGDLDESKRRAMARVDELGRLGIGARRISSGDGD